MVALVLSLEEIHCLRLMLRTVVSRRIMEVATKYRTDAHPVSPAEFSRQVLELADAQRGAETPLYAAFQKYKAIQDQQQAQGNDVPVSVILGLNSEAFTLLQRIALTKFKPDPQYPETNVTTARINAAQPGLKAAFELAADKSKATYSATLPSPNTLN